MTDTPIADQARALADDERFCEWLDTLGRKSKSKWYGNSLIWPHNRTTARRWLEQECGVDSLGHLSRDPEAATAFGQIAERFAAWDQGQ